MAPTKAPTKAPTSAPTAAPEEPCDTEDEIEPAKMEPPASCSDCVDKEPPSSWAEPTCAGQLASGQCAERARMADGFCMASCGACAACTVTPPVDTIHGDPMFRHNGEGFKFAIPVGRPTDLLSWGGGKGGQGGEGGTPLAVLSGTAFER
eukprot:scaffold21817_cov64-Phaeocystis_antarctica.AAC.1